MPILGVDDDAFFEEPAAANWRSSEHFERARQGRPPPVLVEPSESDVGAETPTDELSDGIAVPLTDCGIDLRKLLPFVRRVNDNIRYENRREGTFRAVQQHLGIERGPMIGLALHFRYAAELLVVGRRGNFAHQPTRLELEPIDAKAKFKPTEIERLISECYQALSRDGDKQLLRSLRERKLPIPLIRYFYAMYGPQVVDGELFLDKFSD